MVHNVSKSNIQSKVRYQFHRRWRQLCAVASQLFPPDAAPYTERHNLVAIRCILTLQLRLIAVITQ